MTTLNFNQQKLEDFFKVSYFKMAQLYEQQQKPCHDFKFLKVILLGAGLYAKNQVHSLTRIDQDEFEFLKKIADIAGYGDDPDLLNDAQAAYLSGKAQRVEGSLDPSARLAATEAYQQLTIESILAEHFNADFNLTPS